MGRHTGRVYLYRLPSILRRRWSDYLVLILLIATLGGLAMGSVVIGRRTQSAFSSFLARDNASTFTMSTYGTNFDSPANNYVPSVEAGIRRLPDVQSVEAFGGSYATPIAPDGTPLPEANNEVNIASSIDGVFFDQDRAVVIQGRMANPSSPDEFITSALGARLLHIHLGEEVPFGEFDLALAQNPGFGTTAVPPLKRVQLRLVGIVEFDNQVIQDDTDRLPTNLVLTPAFTRTQVKDFGTWYSVRLKPGIHDLGAVEHQIVSLLPTGSVPNFAFTSDYENRVETALRPESIALGGFGLIAALAALGVCLPVLSRLILNAEDDRRALRAIGAGPGMVAADSYIGALIAVILGAVLAIAVSVALARLAPLGPVHRVYHTGSLTLDWTVIATGLALFIGVLGAVAVMRSFLMARQGTGNRSSIRPPAGSRVAAVAASAGLPTPVVLGARFALEPGQGRTAVPTRSVVLGAALSVTIVVTTLTFSSGLRTLVSRPDLYGWNWSYALTSFNAIPPQARAALNIDPLIQAWSGYADVNLEIDGEEIPALGASSTEVVGPPILTGRAVTGANQVVLGPATLAHLGKELGETIQVGYGSPSTAPLYLPPRPMTIVGTATFPAVSGSSTFAEHVSLGVGALFSYLSLPAAFQAQINQPDPTQDGPPLVFIRYHHGVSSKVAVSDLQRLVGVATKAFDSDPAAAGDTISFEGVQRPAAIVNYQSTGSTSLLLAGALALGAMAALALSLIASVRRRRRDLAILKTLGFTRAQTTATVAAQALVTAVLADAVGIPLGIASGRQLWIAFARSIDAVPAPTVPVSVALVGIITVVVALVMAFVPGRLAARTPAAEVLRVE